jgi:hypothetical protein
MCLMYVYVMTVAFICMVIYIHYMGRLYVRIF